MQKEAGKDRGRLSAKARWAVGGAAALLAAAGSAIAFVLTRPSPQPPVGTEAGFTAPDFALESLQGERVALTDFRGKVVLLVFWQSNCPDCNEAMPELRALWTRYRDRGVVLVGVNLDYELDAALRYVEANGYADQITLRQSYDAAMAVVNLFKVPFVPYTVLMDRRGVIRFAGVYPALPAGGDIERWL